MSSLKHYKKQLIDKKSNILLVMPSYNKCVHSLFTFHEDQSIGHKPPLGLLFIATYLKNQGYTGVNIFDANINNLTPEETARNIIKKNPAIVGFSSMTDVWFTTWKTISLIKEKLHNIIIVIGGPHVSVFPEESLEASKADFAIAGDGEFALELLLNFLSGTKKDFEIDGVFYKKDDGSIVSPSNRIAVIKDFNRLPIPDRSLIGINNYSCLFYDEKTTTMITSRGCPCHCVYCKNNFQMVISRSPMNVIEEFHEISRQGYTSVEVYDDTFTWHKKRVLDICSGIISRNIKIKWSIRSRVNKVDEELLTALKKAGCNRIHFGIESGNPKVLKASKKGITKEQGRLAVKAAKKIGFKVLTYYLTGFLDESIIEAEDTFRFAKELNTDYAVFAILIPYPGTFIYAEALKKGIIPKDYWLEYTKNPVPDFQIPHLIDNHISKEKMIQFINRAHFKYYWRPVRLVQELLAVSSWNGFYKRWNMGLKLLKHYLIVS